MSWYRTGDRERFSAVFRAVLGEALRSPLVRTGWLVLAAFTAMVGSRVSCQGTSALLLAQFAVFFALLCSGETISREYATRRAVVFLGCGVGRRQHYLATCAAWMTVHLVGCWAFGLLYVSIEHFRHPGHSWEEFVGVLALPVMAFPVLCLGFALSVVLPGWSNIGIVLVVLLALNIVGSYEESFGPLSIVARSLLGYAGKAAECNPGGGDLAATLRALGLLAGAAARAALLLAIGAWLVGTRTGRRRLGAAATRTGS